MCFVGTAVTAAFRLPDITQGLSVTEFLPKDSYLVAFFEVQDSEFTRTGAGEEHRAHRQLEAANLECCTLASSVSSVQFGAVRSSDIDVIVFRSVQSRFLF